MLAVTYHIVSTQSGAVPDPLDLGLLVVLLAGISYLTYELVEKRSTTRKQLIPPSIIIIGALIGLAVSFVYLPTINTVQMSPQQTIIPIPLGTATNQTSPGFAPENVTVVIGVNNTVGWRNLDNATHSAHTIDGLYFSGNIPAPNQYGPYTNYVTLTQVGIYKYHCNQHNFMFGWVIVENK